MALRLTSALSGASYVDRVPAEVPLAAPHKLIREILSAYLSLIKYRKGVHDMSTAEITIDQILNLAQTLKPAEKEQLIVLLRTGASQSKSEPRRSLRGLLADLGPAPSAEEIDEAKREMWGNFPREDF
ncbi:MAG: hypothetical protein SF097_00895 [Acidobacteriota bacterium]|nr:hypothetical protein [Acidobacteriota bacterium]